MVRDLIEPGELYDHMQNLKKAREMVKALQKGLDHALKRIEKTERWFRVLEFRDIYVSADYVVGAGEGDIEN